MYKFIYTIITFAYIKCKIIKKSFSFKKDFIYLWWREPDLNWWHTAFQAAALPTELPRQEGRRIIEKIREKQAKIWVYCCLDENILYESIIHATLAPTPNPKTSPAHAENSTDAHVEPGWSTSIEEVAIYHTIAPIIGYRIGYAEVGLSISWGIVLWISFSNNKFWTFNKSNLLHFWNSLRSCFFWYWRIYSIRKELLSHASESISESSRLRSI